MNAHDRSHRRAVWLIVGLVVAFAVSVVGYELSWLRERRIFRARDWPIERDGQTGRTVFFKFQPLPARRAIHLHWLTMWLFREESQGHLAVPYSRVSQHALAAFKGGSFPADVLEDLDQVRHTRWLFPEASIEVVFLVDSETGLPLAADPATAATD